MKKLLVKTAQGYYESAHGLNVDGEVYSHAEKILFMDEVLNHTQSALATAIRLLNRAQYYLDEDHSVVAQEIRKNVVEFIGKFDIEF